MFQCPSCGKGGFKDDIAVAHHMNQPRLGCSTWLQDIIHLQTDYSGMNIDDPHMPHDSESHHLHQDYDDPESLGGVDEGIFTGHTDEDGTLPTTDSIEWFPDASQTYGKGHTFLDLFHSDKNSVYCTKNLYYLFSGRKEWEVASWLLRSGLSMGKINSFLSLEMIKDLSLSFSSAKELRGRAKMLPSGPHWMSQVIPTAHPMKSPVILYWCDPLNCISSILNHPTFHKELDFMPRRVYTTAQQLYHVYSKWMTGNDAWEMQSNLPSGATLLGTILSLDKTNISMMTGDRVAHPFLISLVNIHMSTRLKTSSGAFLLTALLPVPKFTHKKKHLRGVLEDCLIHQVLDIVLAPLKQAAREGVMLSDPVGHSPVVRQKVDPDNIEAFFREAQKFRFNGVDKPFWLDWVMAEPSHFLTPEPVTGFRHFHRRVQRDIQCSIIAVSTDAVPSAVITAVRALMDFCYLVQLTRIDDHDLERILTALAEFHANKQAILDAGFRQGKGGKNIDNWYILKLELMQSITPSIHNTGVSLQWTADTTEHAHITEIKDPAQAGNNNHYDAQICRHLDHADKCHRFGLPASLLDQSNQHTYPDEEDDDKIDVDVDDDRDILTLLHKDVGTIPWPLRTLVVAQHVAVHLAYDPSIRAISIDDTALKFNLPDLRPALADFLRRKDTYGNDHIHTIGGARRAEPNASLPFDKLQVWFKLRLQDMVIHETSIVRPAQTLSCAPPCGLWTSGWYDTAIINHDGGYSWPTDGLRGELLYYSVVLNIVSLNEWPWKDHFLSYVQQFDIVKPPTNNTLSTEKTRKSVDPTKLHLLKRANRLNGTRIGDIIPVTQFRVPVNIVPRFGSKADNRLTPYNSIEHSYWDKNMFFPLSM
ncbi:hypothetical protein DEU56DRAFT_872231 [Suillus clintonianus]|uniref:uncharacterized protein n=1 Tax=Suillus clintonianus TaxID=1904413 RepID=UPI001B86DEC7|nr:uncharacterized protein DEU56DRAFT_872231 [Suillus clintonianus]KAG2131043.1 hypothetical protein DEU56DRAFT_872231 [Suillus clintonianus]